MGASPQEVTIRCVTFLTDYGTSDEFVGVCHGVIAGIAPGIRVIDLAHGVAGVRMGAAVLAQSVGYVPSPSVHLAVVDPGVGTGRRGVVIACTDGSVLVGPDNGLLVVAAAALGGIAGAHELTEPRFRLSRVSPTFHGRDIFAPAAAHLALGVSADSMGPPAQDLVALDEPFISLGEGIVESDVLRIDHFGNVQLAATAGDLERAAFGPRVTVNGLGAAVGRTFADVAAGELLVYVDAYDHAAVARNGGGAAALVGIDRVKILRSD